MGFSIADDYAAMGDELLPFILPDGLYLLRVTKAEVGLTGNQKPKVSLTYEVTEGPHMGRTFNAHVIWSSGGNPVAARISASAFAVLGAPRAWIMGARPSNEEIAAAMVGNVIEAKVKTTEFGGMQRNEIQNFNKTISLNNPAAIAAAAFAAAAVNGATAPAGATLGQSLPPAAPGGVTLGQPTPQQVQQAFAAPQAQHTIANSPAPSQPGVGLPGGWPGVAGS